VLTVGLAPSPLMSMFPDMRKANAIDM